MLIDDVQQAMFRAMKARQAEETAALRLALSALKSAAIDAGKQWGRTHSEDSVISISRRMQGPLDGPSRPRPSDFSAATAYIGPASALRWRQFASPVCASAACGKQRRCCGDPTRRRNGSAMIQAGLDGREVPQFTELARRREPRSTGSQITTCCPRSTLLPRVA